jgi:hypothetical protein
MYLQHAELPTMHSATKITLWIELGEHRGKTTCSWHENYINGPRNNSHVSGTAKAQCQAIELGIVWNQHCKSQPKKITWLAGQK